MIGCYPGSFNPPTIAHLAIADQARERLGLVRLDLVVSRSALGKPSPPGPPISARMNMLRALSIARPWLGVRLTEAQLLVEIAAGYDALVMGADKWHQITDPSWYDGSTAARDAALAALPRVLVAVRPPQPVPDGIDVLELDDRYASVSSSAVRAGAADQMCPEAAASGLW